ncbi:MAG TPA: hypothetical protein EYG92_03210 [Lutibacter sp.]|nr:hypothetical protein [Lutibacter sp.]
MSKIIISCDEATTISDKKQYVEASLWERMKMSYHMLFCKHCRVYDEQNSIITKAIKKNITVDSFLDKKLSTEEKSKLQEKIDINM